MNASNKHTQGRAILDILTFKAMDENEMVETLTAFNLSYRNGEPEVTDSQYDELHAHFKALYPSHPFVNTVEPSVVVDGKGRIAHANPMLSTDKVYSWDEFYKWLDKVQGLANEQGYDKPLVIRFTPKLDGCAGKYAPHEQAKFITRGDGSFGNDFTDLGLQLNFVGDNTVDSVGEVICDEQYYQDILKPQDVKHPRNFVAGIISADTLSDIAVQALKDGAVHFVSYENMQGTLTYGVDELKAMKDQLDDIELDIIAKCPYRTDGVVIQVDDSELFKALGHNNSFHYGQLAKKLAGEPVEVTVDDVVYSVGRTGRISPVVKIEPTEIGGVMVSNLTAHHPGNVKRLKIGKGAVISALRSGEVIPFIVNVLSPASDENVEVPEACPVCSSAVEWVNDFLECQGETCAGKTAAHLQFLTKTLNWDLIGSKAAQRLAEAGVDAKGLLTIDEKALMDMGFGPGQSANIVAERERVFSSPIEDAKILASLGIRMLGQRASRTLLKDRGLSEVSTFTAGEIANIEGFAIKKATVIELGLAKSAELLGLLASCFTNIIPSKIEVTESGITGKNVVFTGAMLQGNRADMGKHAESLGAKVQSSVNGKTDILVAGEKVGASKMNKATSLGVTILSEQEYLDMIAV